MVVSLLVLAGIAAAPFILGSGLERVGEGIEALREGFGIVSPIEFEEEITKQATEETRREKEETKQARAETIKELFPGIALLVILGLTLIAAR